MISTRLTFVQKVLTPFFFPVVAALLWWTGYWQGMYEFLGIFVIVGLIAPIVWYVFAVLPVKTVGIDDDNLYVSNFLREITIPIADIESVTDLKLTEPRRVTIRLTKPSEFGSTIVFLAKCRWYAGIDARVDAHPIVDELNRLAAGKRDEFYPSMLNIP